MKKSFITTFVLVTIMLIITGWKGGELVYRFGLGVTSLPQVSKGSPGDTNGHDHEDEKHGE